MASDKFIDIELLGDKALAKRFRRLEYRAQARIFRPAVREACRPLLALARILVPVRTGNLKKSLKLRVASGIRNAVGMRLETGTREDLGIDKDDKYFYPTVVEYKQQSYLRAAIDDDPDGTRRRIGQGIRKRLGLAI